MNQKRTYILGIIIIVVILVGLFSYRIYAATNEQEIENTITEFFNAFYDVTPDTIDLIISESTSINGETQSVVDYENYAKSAFEGLYTQNFYEKFLLGDRYLTMAPQLASENDFTISCSNVELTAIESSDMDKYYDFTVEIVLKDNVSGTEETLINKGQIRVKQEYFKYKVHALKFYEDKLVKYLN